MDLRWPRVARRFQRRSCCQLMIYPKYEDCLRLDVRRIHISRCQTVIFKCAHCSMAHCSMFQFLVSYSRSLYFADNKCRCRFLQWYINSATLRIILCSNIHIKKYFFCVDSDSRFATVNTGLQYIRIYLFLGVLLRYCWHQMRCSSKLMLVPVRSLTSYNLSVILNLTHYWGEIPIMTKPCPWVDFCISMELLVIGVVWK